MTVHIEQMTSEITVAEGELPLSPEQIEKLIQMVMHRLEKQQRDAQRSRAQTGLRNHAAPPGAVEG